MNDASTFAEVGDEIDPDDPDELDELAEIVKRPMLTRPGEPLLIARSPVEAAIRFGQWLDVTGLAPEDLVVSGLAAVPLPSYPTEWPVGRKRWVGTQARAMWHPLMWLPARVAHRYMVDDPDGGPVRLETDDEWAIRVALELTNTGLYDEENGAWVDILMLAGIDIADNAEQERIAAWLDGADDPVLDHIDITPLLDFEEDPDWATFVALAWIDDLRIVAWANQADDLVDYLSNVLDIAPTREVTLEELRWTAAHVARLAAVHFQGLPDEFRRRYEMARFADPSFWDDAVQRAENWNETDDNGVTGLLETLVPAMLERLQAIRDFFWPELERIQEVDYTDPEVIASFDEDHAADATDEAGESDELDRSGEPDDWLVDDTSESDRVPGSIGTVHSAPREPGVTQSPFDAASDRFDSWDT